MASSNLAGVGLSYQAHLHVDVVSSMNELDFIEVAPEAWSDDIANDLVGRIPLALHGLHLSLCSQQEMDLDSLTHTSRVVREGGFRFFSEHLAFTRSREIDTDLYLPPPHTEESAVFAARRIRSVSHATGVPFLFENVAALFVSPLDEMGEGEFARRVSEKSDCDIILNIDSIAISARTRRMDPAALMRSYPLDRVQSITWVPPRSMNIMLRDFYGSDVDSLSLNLLEQAVRESPARSISIQRRYAADIHEAMRPSIEAARSILKKAERI